MAYFQTEGAAHRILNIARQQGYACAMLKPCKGGFMVHYGYVRMTWE